MTGQGAVEPNRAQFGCRRLAGQGATEYLVVLAVVLIVALVSAALLGFFPGMSADTQLAQSRAYWTSTARPFQVQDAASTYGTLCGSGNSGGYMLAVHNTEAFTLTITSLAADGSTGFCGPNGALNAPVSLGPGERKIFAVITSASASPCTEGKVAQMGLNITYSTRYISDKVQSGSKKLALRCSTPAVTAPPPPTCISVGSICPAPPLDCCVGLDCIGGICSEPPSCPSLGSDCSSIKCCTDPPGLACGKNHLCCVDAGYTCKDLSDCCPDFECIKNKCSTCIKEHQECTGSSQCCSGLVCGQEAGNTCAPGCLDSGQRFCGSDADCCSGRCDIHDEVCVG